MALYRVDTVFPMFTGQPEDIIVNSLHFENANLTLEQFGSSVEVFLNPFWQTIYGAAAGTYAPYIDWSGMKYRTFDMSAPPPRVPYEADGPFDGGFIGSAPCSVPTEVAVVCSFQSVGAVGEVFQRKYNRIFIGAIVDSHIQAATSTEFPRITAAFRDSIVEACEDLLAFLPGPDTLWVQWSQARGTSLPVVGGWVDNSPDTQRRRSVDATLRTTWPTA